MLALPAGVFTTQCAKEFGAALQSRAMVKLEEANLTMGGAAPVLIVAKAELLAGAGEAPTSLTEPAAMQAEPTIAATAVKEEPAAKTPGAAIKSSPYVAATPANHPTPPSAGWCASWAVTPLPVHVTGRRRRLCCYMCGCGLEMTPPRPQMPPPSPVVVMQPAVCAFPPRRAQKVGGSASKRPLQPISALNPYNNNWAVKAKVVNKGPKRRCGLRPTACQAGDMALPADGAAKRRHGLLSSAISIGSQPFTSHLFPFSQLFAWQRVQR